MSVYGINRRPGRPRTQHRGGQGNRILVRGIDVLKTIAQFDGPQTLSELGRAARMSPSRTYRYLEALVESGLVRFDALTGKYSLGAGALELGAAAVRYLGRDDEPGAR